MSERSRGKKSNDLQLFDPKFFDKFSDAIDDSCFLLTRGYAESSIKDIVGARYKLNTRQRTAIGRVWVGEEQKKGRKKKQLPLDEIKGENIWIDGFNLLILLESALSGAYIFKGRDGTYRDISSVHGTYKKVLQTPEAIKLVATILKENQVKSVKWFFDQPVSNSGRLKTLVREIGEEMEMNWEVDLVMNPDKVLAECGEVVVSTDAWILDQSKHWLNLGAIIVDASIQDAELLVL